MPCRFDPSGGGSRIIYAWAMDAPELHLPQGFFSPILTFVRLYFI